MILHQAFLYFLLKVLSVLYFKNLLISDFKQNLIAKNISFNNFSKHFLEIDGFYISREMRTLI